MRTRILLAATLALAVLAARPAAAETIAFDYGGGGCIGGSSTCVALNSLDWLPGNSLLIVNFDESGAPTGTGTILYQANLDSLVTTGGLITNGTGTDDNFYTAVAAFTVTFGPANTFDVNPGGDFWIYVDGAAGNDLAGTGFNDGTEVLQGTALGGFGSFAFSTQSAVDLDSYTPTGNNYPGYLTLVGSGGSQFDLLITQVNSAYFVDLVAGSSTSFTNTSLIDPFRDVDPAAVFFNGEGGVASICASTPTSTTPCVNGTTDRILTQADATSTFETDLVEVVPEPASLILLGSGLLGAAAARRRARKNQK